jgi:hypothetical protein
VQALIHLPMQRPYKAATSSIKDRASALLEPLVERRYDFWAALPGALLGMAVSALAYYLLIQQHAIHDALFLREVVPRSGERRLIAAAALGQTLFLGTAPAVLFATLEALGRRAWAVGAYLIGLWLCLFLLIVDFRLYLLHGRHLLEIVAYAALPEGRQAGGSPWIWATRFSIWALQAALLSGSGLVASLIGCFGCSKVRSVRLRQLLAPPLFVTALGVGPVCVNAGAGWVTLGLQSRLLGVLPISFGAERTTYTRPPEDPIQAQLHQGLVAVYQQKFGYLFRKRPPLVHARRALAHRPNVFLILVESWRADAFTAELMPKLHAWAQQGVRRSRHYAGTNFSESGAFTILYGLNPLVFHAVLDSRVPPPLCEGVRALSYACAYYTGHPTVWWRREEFLGPDTFDIHVRAQQGPWSDWDRESLGALVGLTQAAQAGGYFGMTFLMSTHYEYRYPSEFERFLPADEPAVAWKGRDVKDFASLANRYRNAVGFVDHLIGETLSAIDITKDYVIVTGDHAEAVGEHGKLGHGFDFSDLLVHVPLILRGPGISPEEVGGLSLHEDIWPTILSLVTNTPPREHDLRLESARHGTVMAHCEFDQKSADALLLHDNFRIRLKLALDSAELSLQGFEDADGRPVPSPRLGPTEIQTLIAAFDSYLDDAAKPILVVP